MIEFDKLVSDLVQIKTSNAFRHYIKDIHFPYYRNLEGNTIINFNFPLTVFIGQNGCGKSSTLHALYGTVKGKTPSEFFQECEPFSDYFS